MEFYDSMSASEALSYARIGVVAAKALRGVRRSVYSKNIFWPFREFSENCECLRRHLLILQGFVRWVERPTYHQRNDARLQPCVAARVLRR